MPDRPAEHSSVDARGIRPPDAFLIEARDPADGVLVVRFEGEFDMAAADVVREQLQAARAAAGRGVVCDFSAVTFVDSSGLRELLQASRACREEGKAFALAAPPPAVIRLFELTGVTEAIASAPTLERALTLLAGRP